MDKFKVGDRVEVIDGNGKISAKNGDLGTVVSADKAEYIAVDFDNGNSCMAWRLDRFKVVDETMTLKEAMKLCIDGAKVCFEGSQYPKNHMKFDGKNFVYFEDGEYEVAGDALLRQTQWKLWKEPETPPRFKPRQLIRNATGDIRFVVSDEGVINEIRRYKVRFSTVDGGSKSYDESMLFEVSRLDPQSPPKFKPDQLVSNKGGDIGFIVFDQGFTDGVRRYGVVFSANNPCQAKICDELMLYEVVL